jgi:hypothetical protein
MSGYRTVRVSCVRTYPVEVIDGEGVCASEKMRQLGDGGVVGLGEFWVPGSLKIIDIGLQSALGK